METGHRSAHGTAPDERLVANAIANLEALKRSERSPARCGNDDAPHRDEKTTRRRSRLGGWARVLGRALSIGLRNNSRPVRGYAN
jgi:hypothetical protein